MDQAVDGIARLVRGKVCVATVSLFDRYAVVTAEPDAFAFLKYFVWVVVQLKTMQVHLPRSLYLLFRNVRFHVCVLLFYLIWV